jgi:adenylate cyclase
METLERIRRRKLVQWVLAYMAAAWLALQFLDLLAETFLWPDVVERIATIVLGIGVLAAVVVAWYHGERGQQRVSGPELLMLAGVFVLAAAAAQLLSRQAEPTAAAAMRPTAVTSTDRNSIAVLPFVNMSGDRDNEYFSDGLTEELLNVLAQLAHFRVAARTSSFAFRNHNLAIDSIARALRVANVLEGSVRKTGTRVKITAQLINSESGYHLWSQTYERELEDIFRVQEEIARAIAAALEVKLGARAEQQLGAARTANMAAYDAYLRGLHFWNRRTAADLTRAASYFEQAIAADGRYAQAYGGLAQAQVVLPFYSAVAQRDALRRASSTAQTAITLDPSLSEPHAVLGLVHQSSFRWNEAEAEYRRALALNPSNATGHQWYGSLLGFTGRTEEALQHMRTALELDPLSRIINHDYALLLYMARRNDEAIRQFRTTLELDSLYGYARSNLGLAYLRSGMTEEALRELQRAVALSPDRWPVLVGNLGYAYGRLGRRREAVAIARELEERARTESPRPLSLAYVYAGLGDAQRALEFLEAAVDQQDPALTWGSVRSPEFEMLTTEPRFMKVIARMKLE